MTLNARKSWVTSAHEADSYIWSSKPVRAEGPMALWFVPSNSPGLNQRVFDALVVMAAGAWDAPAIIGFPDDEAAELSLLHTRNLM